MILDEKQLKELYLNSKSAMPEINYHKANFGRVKKAYNSIKYDEINQNKTLKELQSTVDSMVEGFAMGESAIDVRLQHSDVRHISYFNQFMYDGATNDILKALNENGIPTSVLRGLRYKKVEEGETFRQDFNIDGVEVSQEIELDDEGYPVVVGFSITKNGEQIYGYGTLEEDEVIEVVDTEDFEEDFNYDEYLFGYYGIKPVYYTDKYGNAQKRYYDTNTHRFTKIDTFGE